MNSSLPEPPTSSQADRPIAGIIVALVLGIINIIWFGAVIFRGPPTELRSLFGVGIAFVGNTVLVIGALLSYARHPSGNRTVRITCYSMLVLLVLQEAMMFTDVKAWPKWSSLDPIVAYSVVVGIVGVVIGTALVWIFILFLFRKRRWKQ